MKNFIVRYVRTVYETYEVEIEAENEEQAEEVVLNDKYNEGIEGETLTDSYSDHVEINEVEEIDE